jgi:hypothetical protein
MTTKLDSPIVFISYSWSPITNKNWVIDLAERLSRDGVHIIIDEWDTKEGQDKFAFMEQMVNRDDVSFVLLICNRDYAEKANKKKGGVGIESQIISSEIYNKIRQEKFIPVVREYDELGNPCLPTFVKSRFFVDLCDGESYEENYEQLLRRIFNKPKHNRPPLGEPPSYLTSEASIFIRTAHKTKPLKDAVINGKSSTEGLIQDFFEAFFESIEDFRFKQIDDPNNPPIDELILEKLTPLKILRDEYLDIINLLFKFNKIDNESLFQFFENLAKKTNSGISDPYHDFNNHLQIFLNEIFLYTATLLLKYEKFHELETLLKRHYAIERQNGTIEFESYCTTFNEYCQYLDRYRNNRLDLKRVSVTADIIIERATNKLLTSNDLIDTDLLLHYAGLLLFKQSWFPRLSVYRRYWGTPIIVQKMQSKRFFEKIKILFNVVDENELSEKISRLEQNIYDGVRGIRYNFPPIFNVFDFQKINKLN